MILSHLRLHSVCQSLHRFSRNTSTSIETNTSIWPREKNQFDQLSKDWWNPDGYLALLHRMNTTRIAYLQMQVKPVITSVGTAPTGIIRQWLKKQRVLDVGCGGGILAESMARLGATVLGIDISSKSIHAAQQHQRTDPSLSKNLIYRVATADTLLHEHQQFDLITAMEILEHIRHPETFLTTLCALLAPGGRLVISTIERTALSFILTIVAAEQILQLVPRHTHVWHQMIRREELKNWIACIPDVSLVDCRGVIYIPWKRTWKIMDANSTWAQQCNYFMTIRKKF
ncbi:hypothetical protein PCK1_001682 [Pneumocystis canis]|nr:hypothetical protein PCK1_001682 [Pneumocystis canis]